jgi:hypothetical protein
MSIVICPKCRQRSQVAYDQLGLNTTCPWCHRKFLALADPPPGPSFNWGRLVRCVVWVVCLLLGAVLAIGAYVPTMRSQDVFQQISVSVDRLVWLVWILIIGLGVDGFTRK